MIVLLLSTFPDRDAAITAVRTLVEKRLVACGNIVPGVESIYRWQGSVETSAEVMVIFKTTADSAEAAQARLRELHPYEVPEILQLPVDAGWAPYLDWVRDSTSSPRTTPRESA
jgi:periplasmic divalent cation tolerance protein